MTSPSLSIDSKTGSPVSLLTSRVMCLSTISRRTWRGTTSMNCWPERMRATFSSSNTRSVPGRPSAAPVMTTGSDSGGAAPSGTAGGAVTGRTAATLPGCAVLLAAGGEDGAAAVDEIGDQAAEFGVTVFRHGCSRWGK